MPLADVPPGLTTRQKIRHSFAAALRALTKRAGFTLLHHTDDAVLSALRDAHERLRLQNPGSLTWSEQLSQPAAAACLRRLIDLHDIDLILDVGANRGQFAQHVRRLGYTGQIVSFEPLPQHRAHLESLAANDPAWRIIPCAVGEHRSTAELTVLADDTFSSFHPINATGADRFGALVQATGRLNVPVQSLDELWAEVRGRTPRRVLLKSDTQGHELAVLAGATQVLREAHAVVLEGSIQPIYDQVPPFAEICQWLHQRDFALAGVFPLSFRPEDLSLLEVDCLFTRRAARPA